MVKATCLRLLIPKSQNPTERPDWDQTIVALTDMYPLADIIEQETRAQRQKLLEARIEEENARKREEERQAEQKRKEEEAKIAAEARAAAQAEEASNSAEVFLRVPISLNSIVSS